MTKLQKLVYATILLHSLFLIVIDTTNGLKCGPLEILRCTLKGCYCEGLGEVLDCIPPDIMKCTSNGCNCYSEGWSRL
ncbi:hypothetical protein MtrunA17_Chr5g0415671 [Medicago truncatula]|uniref:Nodule Cysteine-Rich (NCR) secreted peptide n=1 Tax=Medicago truncatula TaxID=3880 RepID=A0A396HPI4_MEDTR|nr:hypothetical protein MtrunA17_Chr5g0415671 [Medicago truncatula]